VLLDPRLLLMVEVVVLLLHPETGARGLGAGWAGEGAEHSVPVLYQLSYCL